jgi:peptide/nickel transport system permease protein
MSSGRDILSRLIVGTRISLFVGLISVLISLLIGIVAGALAGYYRGWVDSVVMWIINVCLVYPHYTARYGPIRRSRGTDILLSYY